MRTKRQDPDIFSFSFVDILATTIGVLVFIMVLALLDVARRVSPDQFRQAAMRSERVAVEKQQERQRWREKTREILPLVKRYEEAVRQNGLAPAGDDLKRLRRESTRLREQNARLEDQRRELQRQIQDDADGMTRLAHQAEEERTWVRAPFRVPEERETQKRPVAFECGGRKVYFMGIAGELDSAAYTRRGIAGFAFAERTHKARGESSEEAGKTASRFSYVLSRMNPDEHYGLFFVREDSFRLFRDLRRRMWERGLDTNWQPLTKRQKILLGEGKGGATVM